MSWQLLAWASQQRTGSATRKAVLIALANRANHDTGLCCPSVDTISDETELSRTAVKNALAKLCEDGLLERERTRRANGSLGTYTYTFPRARADQPGTADGSRPGTRGGSRPGTADDPRNQEVPNQEDLNQELTPAVPAERPYDPLKGAHVDGRNLPFDALVEVTQADERTEEGKLGRALKTIRKVVVEDYSDGPEPVAWISPDATESWIADRERFIADRIRNRAALYRSRWPNVELTPTALASNWSRVASGDGRSAAEAVDVAQRAIDQRRGQS